MKRFEFNNNYISLEQYRNKFVEAGQIWMAKAMNCSAIFIFTDSDNDVPYQDILTLDSIIEDAQSKVRTRRFVGLEVNDLGQPKEDPAQVKVNELVALRKKHIFQMINTSDKFRLKNKKEIIDKYRLTNYTQADIAPLTF